VPRHKFVPPRLWSQAYDDTALPIGYRQTISPPFIVAYMTQTIDPQPADRVLEIGTGSGYQAAVLAELAKEVYTIEIVEPLGKTAAQRLAQLGYDNVFVKIGDGYQGWPEHAPFDKIIVTCSPEDVPPPLVEQLREGGRMVIPLGERYQQVFHLLEKRRGRLIQRQLLPALFVPMTGTAEARRKRRPDPLRPAVVNGGFERDDNCDGRADNWHYQRQATRIRDGSAPEGDYYVALENQTPSRLAQLLQGFAVDGRHVSGLDVSLWVRVHAVRPGRTSQEVPALALYFYDRIRRSIGWGAVGPWTRRSGWRRRSKTIRVPVEAREAIVRVGLNGAIGRIDIDDVQLRPALRP
ncbi:MAG TPA: protein-L-isoaspartate(D-aspartate) O-methyltransferase, partial [Planctomycetaceae bacterium]|nr:protein-L-isoaspartate(D-aspartate) O-methyltransferase [Planctomycetaceae bacterium]